MYQKHVAPLTYFSDCEPIRLLLLYVLSGETSNDNSIVLGLIKPTW